MRTASQFTVAGIAACIGLAALTAPSDAQLVGLWRFDDAGNIGLDSSSSGNNLTAYGGATYSPTGQFGGALSLDPAGGDDWLGIAGDTGNGAGCCNGGSDQPFTPGTDLNNIPLGGSSYTISAFIKPSPGIAGNAGIIGWGNYASGNQTNAFRLDSEDGLNNYWWGNDLNSGDVLPGADQFTDGNWRHVAVTYDASAVGDDHKIFVDGVQVLQRDSNNAINVAAENFRIGATAELNENWLGELDDVAIFDEALTLQQIQDIGAGDFSQFGVGVVPEPASIAIWSLLGLSALGYGFYRRRMKK